MSRIRILTPSGPEERKLRARTLRHVDDTRTPIKDASIAWDVPPLKVAQVRIPSCDLDNPHTSALSEVVNQLSFSPFGVRRTTTAPPCAT
jgi:hypothetical protein